MATLDDSRIANDPASVSVWPTALRYGGIVSLVLIVIGLVAYLAGFSDPANPTTISQVINYLNYILIIIAIVLAIKAHRDKELGGYITMGRSIGMGVATSLIIGVINGVWVIIFMTFIFPDMAEIIKDTAMEQAQAQPGQEEMVEKMVGIFTSPFVIALMFLGMTLFMGLITSLVTGAVLKKDPAPNV